MTAKSEPYQYGVRTQGNIQRYPQPRYIVESICRDWVISPLRTGPRKAELLRRRGWNGEWQVIATWTSPMNEDAHLPRPVEYASHETSENEIA